MSGTRDRPTRRKGSDTATRASQPRDKRRWTNRTIEWTAHNSIRFGGSYTARSGRPVRPATQHPLQSSSNEPPPGQGGMPAEQTLGSASRKALGRPRGPGTAEQASNSRRAPQHNTPHPTKVSPSTTAHPNPSRAQGAPFTRMACPPHAPPGPRHGATTAAPGRGPRPGHTQSQRPTPPPQGSLRPAPNPASSHPTGPNTNTHQAQPRTKRTTSTHTTHSAACPTTATAGLQPQAGRLHTLLAYRK